jgi:hypothetical protein
VALLLSGCINAEVRQVIDSNGKMSGSLNAVVNLTSFYVQQGLQPENYSDADPLIESSICGSLSNSSNLTGVKCGISNAILTVSGNFNESNLTKAEGFFKSTGLFNSEYLFAPNTSGFGQFSGASGTDPVRALTEAKKQGANMTYVIDMPGEVYEAGGGRIVEGDAVFDLIDVLTNEKTIYARSRAPNGDFFGWFSLVAFAIILASPLLRWAINRKRKNSLYKEGPGILGTLLFIFFMIVLISVFLFESFSFFSGPGDLFSGFGLLFFLAIFVYSLVWFLGTDFEVSVDGIFTKQYFMEKRIRFSEVKKIERAEMDSIFFLGDWKVATPTGARVHPSETVYGGKNFRKGVLLYLKDGRTVYCLVRDGDWVIDAVRARI